MKLHNPIEVADFNMDYGLVLAILIVVLTLFALGLIFNPALLIVSIIALALFRIGKAIIKGE